MSAKEWLAGLNSAINVPDEEAPDFAYDDDDFCAEGDDKADDEDGEADDLGDCAASLAGTPTKGNKKGAKGGGGGVKKAQLKAKPGMKWCRGHQSYHPLAEFAPGQAICHEMFYAQRALRAAAVRDQQLDWFQAMRFNNRLMLCISLLLAKQYHPIRLR